MTNLRTPPSLTSSFDSRRPIYILRKIYIGIFKANFCHRIENWKLPMCFAWTLWDSNPRSPACKADVLANWTKGPNKLDLWCALIYRYCFYGVQRETNIVYRFHKLVFCVEYNFSYFCYFRYTTYQTVHRLYRQIYQTSSSNLWTARESNSPLSPCKGETPALVHAGPIESLNLLCLYTISHVFRLNHYYLNKLQ